MKVEMAEQLVRFRVFTAIRMKESVFWDVAACSVVETDNDVLEVLTDSVIRIGSFLNVSIYNLFRTCLSVLE
jgi:hypothetical protein